MFEVDAFLPSAPAQHEERCHGEHHTHPLPQVEPLAEEEECAQKHHYGPCGIDWSYDGERQMLHSEVSEEPGRQHDQAFRHDVFVCFPSSHGDMKLRAIKQWGETAQQDERQENERAEKGVEEEHGNDSIGIECLLLERVVASEQSCGDKSHDEPHHLYRSFILIFHFL